MHPLIKLYKYSHLYKKDIVIAFLYSILNKIFDIFPEVLIGLAVDIVVRKQNSLLSKFGIYDLKMQIVSLGVITATIWVLESLFQYLYSIKWCFLAQNIQHDLRMDTYSHVQKLQLDYFENKAIGNIMATLNDDINQLERFINDGVNQIVQITASTVLIAIVFFIISTKIALLSFIPIPIIILGSIYFRKFLAPKYLLVRNTAANLNSKLNNNLLGIATIKSFTNELFESNQINNLSTLYKNANKGAIIFNSSYVPIIRLLVMSGFLVSLVYGGLLTLNGNLQIALYSILIFLSQRLLWPLTYLGEVIDTYQRSMASTTRVMEILDHQISILDGNKTLPNNSKRTIVFNMVSFKYPNRYINVFTNLSFNIKAGQRVAFVGTTGCGKSTIVKLLLRFYDSTSGLISIDNINIKELTLKSLRENIGLVSQDTFLIDGSIKDNIAYGNIDYINKLSKEDRINEIMRVAKLAEADSFINNLPQKYDTLIGERGQKLSGGQKQRLAIARALLKNPSILILDEATSSLDNKTEAQIQRALDTATYNRTTIVIAHRLSTIINADIIYVLRYGHIVEFGTHNELLIQNGIYRELWNLQLREQEIKD